MTAQGMPHDDEGSIGELPTGEITRCRQVDRNQVVVADFRPVAPTARAVAGRNPTPLKISGSGWNRTVVPRRLFTGPRSTTPVSGTPRQ